MGIFWNFMKLFETEKNKEFKKLRMAQDREWKNIVEDAEETTKELCEKYYEVMDQKRHQITKLYSNDAILVYEGNKIKSSKEIGDFYGKMPSSSHRVTTLDAQPISQTMLNGISSVLVSASGTVKWNTSGGGQPQVKAFTQHMILSMIDSNWLIVSDTVRLCNSQHTPKY